MIDRKGGNVLMGRSEGFPSHVIHIPTNKKKKRRKHTVGTYDRSIKILNLETQKAKNCKDSKKRGCHFSFRYPEGVHEKTCGG